MKLRQFAPTLLAAAAVVCPAVQGQKAASQTATPKSPTYGYCSAVVNGIRQAWAQVQSGSLQSQMSLDQLWFTQIEEVLNHPSCFAQANLTNPAVNSITPGRVAFWNAVESLGGSQQQGSSLPSTGSTNAVTKPSSVSALVEEFGGANVTQGTSSLTAQWSPGTMVENFVSTGAVPLCVADIQEKSCISAGLMNGLAPLIFKITANTSSGTPSTTGTAATSSSTSAAQPVTVSAAGSKGPDFGGLTVQYSFFSQNSVGSKAVSDPSTASSGVAQTYLTAVSDMLKAVNLAGTSLESCDGYTKWKSELEGSGFPDTVKNTLESKVSTDADQELSAYIANQYSLLLTNMAKSKLAACQTALSNFRELFADIERARALEDIAAQQSNEKPVLAFEYDLNTPQNKPSYSTAKGTLTWSWRKFGTSSADSEKAPGTTPFCEQLRAAGRELHAEAEKPANSVDPCTQKPEAPFAENATTPDGKPALPARQRAFLEYAVAQGTTQGASAPVAGASSAPTAKAAGKAAAQAAVKPWTVTMTASGDFYDAEPPASIPSASHVRDVQAGAELAYLFAPSLDSGSLRTAIGDITLAGGYSYQDQTSPAILTGPALTDFTGLPSSTTTAYAKRGVIHVAQVRMGLGSGTNISYPLSFTYSNRTELVTHPTWGVQFGVSYNLNSLFSSSSGKTASQ